MNDMRISDCLVSFILPTYNEEANIAETLEAIQNYHPDCPFEVILVDNGSTDQTVPLAQQFKASILIEPTATIAQLRNLGCRKAIGNIFVFLDADVRLTSFWKENITNTLMSLIQNPLQITGSRCLSDSPTTWLNKYWFNRLGETKSKYVNSGHMITTATMFNKIGGFKESLETAEDYDFCLRARSCGASIANNQNIPVMHLGYPISISDFIQRERWHGSTDFKCMSNFLNSKTAQAAVIRLLLLVSVVIMIIIDEPFVALGLLATMVIMSFLLTIIKFGISNPITFINTSLIFEFYLFGRSLACIDSLIGRPKTSGHRR